MLKPICLDRVLLVSTVVLTASAAVFAQGTPQLSVTPNAYRTLVPSSTLVTAAMCRPADTFCLNNAVGKPLFRAAEGMASDALGNFYISDETNAILYGAFAAVVALLPAQAGLSPPPTASASTAIAATVTPLLYIPILSLAVSACEAGTAIG